uniref:Fe2OG dioxygenase domain-containing protein n=1 Tax=Craspedostauros australis TaxID=1486917 RepID=A0A7R9WPI0_9STRA|mmetsp:Transcript_14154/g.39008  ORF Transcript_14154/g.39008 Transcript_14154/m.39008 type:complete len:325 (+) Transcript_14154:235-1209(+)
MRSPTSCIRFLTTAAITLLLAVVLAAADLESPTNNNGYSFDCSFPIFAKNNLDDCKQDLGDKASFYENYMQGCRDKFGDICDTNEAERFHMNNRQPISMRNFTETGFVKIRAPDNVVELIRNFWEINQNNRKEEVWYTGNIYTNHWAVPTDFVGIEDEELEGAGPELADAIWDAAKTTIEEWTGMKQRPSSVYGVRVYNEGAVLSPHCDRIPLISSAIVNVAQDVDEDWPIEVYGHDGKAVNVTMEPGDMVLYESGSIIHGRPFPLVGRYYANIFIHFEPYGFMDGRRFVNDEDPDLPPYVQAGSRLAEYQHENFLDVSHYHRC